MHHPISLLRIAGLSLLLLPTTMLPLHGQEIGIEYGVTRAGYEDAVEQPRGVGGHLDVPLSKRFALRVVVRHHTERLVIERSPCTGLVPPDEKCAPEVFDGDARLTTYGAGLVVHLPSLFSRLRPELYGLAQGVSVDADFASRTSDATIGPITPEGLSPAVALGGNISYGLTRAVDLSARAGVDFPAFGTCGADAWFAFCESRPLVQMGVGVQVRLSELGS